jgi:hypothetical protein
MSRRVSVSFDHSGFNTFQATEVIMAVAAVGFFLFWVSLAVVSVFGVLPGG